MNPFETCRSTRNRISVLLTLDDGPGKDFFRKTDFLHRRGLFAVFFCVGQLLEQKPDAGLHALRRGFHLANHSWSHRRFSDLSRRQQHEEILRTDRLIDDLYHSAGISRPGRYFRFPFLDRGDAEDAAMTRGLLVETGHSPLTGSEGPDCGFTFDTRDYWYPAKSQKLKRFFFEQALWRRMRRHLKTARREERAEVFVMHDAWGSHPLFDKTIQFLQKQQIVFLTAATLDRIPVPC